MISPLMQSKTVAVIVAHPDDETLWSGGTILDNPGWNCFILSLSRGNDRDRSYRFNNALKILNSEGTMGCIDDSPEQKPLDANIPEQAILNLLPPRNYDLIITHNPNGEYTRHLRHEETGRAVIKLWKKGEIRASELWLFAYSDENKKHFPTAVLNAGIYLKLSKQIWKQKYCLITETYGFEKRSFEAETTPRQEAFHSFTDPLIDQLRLNQILNLNT
jgi:LmbE family N-acetylglucosaminyl deacetylase